MPRDTGPTVPSPTPAKTIPCPIPGAPKWARPWPGDASDDERLQWIGDLETAARQSANSHLADFCRAYGLIMIVNSLKTQIVALRDAKAILEQKLESKTQLSIDEHAARVFEAIGARIEDVAREKIEIAIAQIELRFGRQADFESAQLKRLGDLSRNIDALEQRLAELTAATR